MSHVQDVSTFQKSMCLDLGEEGFDLFNQSLAKWGAMIAGGYVLAAYTDFTSSDIDIYIQQKNASGFIKDIGSFVKVSSGHLASVYDDAFMQKNHILSRICAKFLFNSKALDILIVHNEVSLESVVTNFDLTFCETWYCAVSNSVHSTERDLSSKTGVLRGSYVAALCWKDNKYTRRRLRKYQVCRQFRIFTDGNSSNEICFSSCIRSNVERDVSWTVHFMISLVYNLLSKRSRVAVSMLASVPDLTLGTLEDVVTTYVQPMICKRLRFESQCLLKSLYIEVALSKTTPAFDKMPTCEIVKRILDISDQDIAIYKVQNSALQCLPTVTLSRNLSQIVLDLESLSAFTLQAVMLDESMKTFQLPSGHVTCFQTDVLVRLYLLDKSSNWFYPSIGTEYGNGNRTLQYDVNKALIGLPIDVDALKICVPVVQVQSMLMSKDRLFLVEPDLDQDGIQIMVTHSISHGAAFPSSMLNSEAFVSANHCQRGSNLMVYKLSTLCDKPDI